jgi:catechol 2,3-dioxygenase-like lactoylglutathione lyase family enzyme
MSRVTGIGGVFFKARDPDALRAWYRTHLGLDIQPWGGVAFKWREGETGGREGATIWSLFEGTSDYFGSDAQRFMINYRVDDLARVLAELRAEGCAVVDKVEESEFGKFGWVHDPEGNRLELWEPPPGKFS